MSTGASEIALRLPRSAYLIVMFVLFGVIPLALAQTGSTDLSGSSHFGATGVAIGPRLALLLIPVVIAFYVARTATFVGPDGIRVRALLGTRTLGWDAVRGLSVRERAIYAVIQDGTVRLPCARIAHLHAIAEASDGRLPEMEQHVAKPAPSRRRRR